MEPNGVHLVESALGAALSAVDQDAIARDVSRLVRARSITGSERGAAAEVVAMAHELDLDATLVEHDLQAVRSADGYPGEEAPRAELVGALVTLRGGEGPRLCLNGHIDVVAEGTETWAHDPWSGDVEGDTVHGRGAVDMKGGVVAALHALGALKAAGVVLAGDVVLQAVPSEEDGGLGTFAALETDDDFAACLIPEPTEFGIVCAQAGALTFSGVVRGKTAHAAVRLEGISAIDRYVPIHQALQAYERELNARPRHPLLADHPLPYPLLVGQVSAGRWSSQVPEELRFEGRVGVPVGTSVQHAREEFEAVVHAVASDVEITWTGGQFGSGATAPDDPWVHHVRAAAAEELGTDPPLVGVPYGADMRLFCDRAIPCVMFGPRGLNLAHAVDERVSTSELASVSRTIVRVLCGWGSPPTV
jgi:acetylornithine deacetylase